MMSYVSVSNSSKDNVSAELGDKGLITFIRLHNYYVEQVLPDPTPWVLEGIKSCGLYYVGSKDNTTFILTMLLIAQQTFQHLSDDVLNSRLKTYGCRILRGAFGTNGAEICGIRTAYGVLWYSGAPGKDAPPM